MARAARVAQQEQLESAVLAECLVPEESVEQVERRGHPVAKATEETAAPVALAGIRLLLVWPEVTVARVVLVQPRQQVWPVTVVLVEQVGLVTQATTELSLRLLVQVRMAATVALVDSVVPQHRARPVAAALVVREPMVEMAAKGSMA